MPHLIRIAFSYSFSQLHCLIDIEMPQDIELLSLAANTLY
jgi:hypothetical protein